MLPGSGAALAAAGAALRSVGFAVMGGSLTRVKINGADGGGPTHLAELTSKVVSGHADQAVVVLDLARDGSRWGVKEEVRSGEKRKLRREDVAQLSRHLHCGSQFPHLHVSQSQCWTN